MNFPSTAETSAISPIGPVSYGWVASDLNRDGTVGEAHLATAEKGKATAQHQAAGLVELLKTVRDTDIGKFQPISTPAN